MSREGRETNDEIGTLVVGSFQPTHVSLPSFFTSHPLTQISGLP